MSCSQGPSRRADRTPTSAVAGPAGPSQWGCLPSNRCRMQRPPDVELANGKSPRDGRAARRGTDDGWWRQIMSGMCSGQETDHPLRSCCRQSRDQLAGNKGITSRSTMRLSRDRLHQVAAGTSTHSLASYWESSTASRGSVVICLIDRRPAARQGQDSIWDAAARWCGRYHSSPSGNLQAHYDQPHGSNGN